MKLLFDQNISHRLVGRLAAEFPHSSHVVHLGLDISTDREIWDYAGKHGFTIVPKDTDFRQLAFLKGPPPKAIWIRLGNTSTLDICDVLRGHLDIITRFGASAEDALLILP